MKKENIHHNNKNIYLQELKLWNLIKSIQDPEININIVDLGLIYSLKIKKSNTNNLKKYNILIDMTLTNIGCSMGPYLIQEIKKKFSNLKYINKTIVNIVWDPPWNKDMISKYGKMQLGLI